MKQIFLFFHAVYSDIFYSIQIKTKNKKHYVATNHEIDFISQ